MLWPAAPYQPCGSAPHVEANDIAKLLMVPFVVNQCACFDDEEDKETIWAAISASQPQRSFTALPAVNVLRWLAHAKRVSADTRVLFFLGVI
jgi:hypothetical protein